MLKIIKSLNSSCAVGEKIFEEFLIIGPSPNSFENQMAVEFNN